MGGGQERLDVMNKNRYKLEQLLLIQFAKNMTRVITQHKGITGVTGDSTTLQR